jgi:hypothetical protein
MKDLLIEEFREDPLYRMIIISGLQDDLFPDEILSLHTELSYSTVEAGRILKRPDSTIRNHFRSPLIEYIAPEKFGKYYRLNYKSIFRLHMIFLLIDKASKTTIDLMAELGLYPTIKIGEDELKKVRPNSKEVAAMSNENMEKRMERIEETLNMQGMMLNLIKYEQDINEINNKISLKKMEISKLKSDHHLNFLEEKHSILQTYQMRLLLNKKSSFFDIFKRNKNNQFNQQEVEDQINSIKEKYDKELEQKIKELENEISALENRKKEKLAMLEEERKKILDTREKYIDSEKLLEPLKEI